MAETTFTVEKGIQVQNEQLAEWESIMKPEVFQILKTYCEGMNEELLSGKASDVWGNVMIPRGHNVFRGTDMQNWIANNLMKR